jgi:hypothetical protein
MHRSVIAPSRSQCFLGVFARFEDVRAQALRTQPRVERLNVRVVGRLPEIAEIEPRILAIGPRIQEARRELRSVVYLPP